MKYTFNVKILGKDKKTPLVPSKELTNMSIDIDDFHSTETALEAEKEALDIVEETKIREYHQAHTELEIEMEIILVKILKD